jgi:hypothetical protein
MSFLCCEDFCCVVICLFFWGLAFHAGARKNLEKNEN